MATVKEVIEKAYTKVNGEYEQIIEGSDDFKTYLNMLNQSMDILVHTPYVKWQTFFDMNYKLPEKVVEGQLTYSIPDIHSITVANSPYDSVFFLDDMGVVVEKRKIVNVAQFKAVDDSALCAIAGERLYLKSATGKIVNSNICLPAYVDPKPYTAGAQEVIIDSVPWLVTMMAAMICDASPVPFIARNADKYYKQAEIFMKEMRDSNRRSQMLVLKGVTSEGRRTWDDVLKSMTLKDL